MTLTRRDAVRLPRRAKVRMPETASGFDLSKYSFGTIDANTDTALAKSAVEAAEAALGGEADANTAATETSCQAPT